MKSLAELQPQITTRLAYEENFEHQLISPTEFIHDEFLSNLLQADIIFASELGKNSGAYKERGVYTWFVRNILNVSTDIDEIVTMSAGNHGAALAKAGYMFEENVRLFMPTNTPAQKVDNVQRLGGDYVTVVRIGNTVDEAAEAAQDYMSTKSDAIKFIHPFDDPDVVSGQGTLGHEIIAAHPDVNVISIPVGGGGLFSGIVHATHSHNSAIHYIGAEPIGAASLLNALTNPGVPLDSIDSFVDGAAVKRAGNIATEVIRYLNEGPSQEFSIVGLTRDEIRRAVTYMWQNKRYNLRPELAGALGVAAIIALTGKDLLEKGSKVVIPLTGGNLDQERYEKEVRLIEKRQQPIILDSHEYNSINDKIDRV